MAFNPRGHDLAILLGNIGPGAVDILRMGIEMGIRLSLETYGEQSSTEASRKARVYLLTRGSKPAAMFRFPVAFTARHLNHASGGVYESIVPATEYTTEGRDVALSFNESTQPNRYNLHFPMEDGTGLSILGVHSDNVVIF